MREKLLAQARREYSPKQRFVALLFAAPFFLGLLPYILITLGRALDRRLRWSPRQYRPINLLLGGLFMAGGWLLGMWSVHAQFTLGRGTPVPLMATQKLVVQPPYTYCRNPMVLGTIVMYLGVAIAIGSPGAAVLVLLGTAALLTYVRRVEEKEMELRFGQEYLAYKQRTPFLIPRLRRNA